MKNLQFPINNITSFSFYFGNGDYKTLMGIQLGDLIMGKDSSGIVYCGKITTSGFTGHEYQDDCIRTFIKGQVVIS